MATTIGTGYANAPLKQGEPPDHGFLYTGKGLDFDGVTDYIDTGSAFQDIWRDSFTVSLWVKPADGTPSSNEVLFGTTIAGEADRVIVSSKTDGDIQIIYESDDDQVIGLSEDEFDNASGQWQYLVFTATSGGNIVTYINGKVTNTTDASSATFSDWTSGINLYIGANNENNTASGWFDGMISNFQMWNAAWSLSDVQYAYTHPEKLASSNGGTSLTESNLKLWYPMNEGNPRSPQTTVYDATPVELGSEMIVDGDFALTGTQAVSTTGTYWTTGSSWTIANGKATYEDIVGGYNSLIQAEAKMTTPFEDGKRYKITFDISDLTAVDTYFQILDEDSNAFDILGSTAQEIGNGSYTYYVEGNADTDAGLSIKVHSLSDVFSISNISCKPMTVKNHGTTVFYGDELIAAAKNQNFSEASDWQDSGTTANQWAEDSGTYNESTSSGATEGTALTAYDGTTVTFTDNYLKLVATSDGSHLRLAELDGAAFETNMVTGRTYRLSYAIEITAYTSGTLSIGFGDTDVDTAADKTYTATKSVASDYFDFVYSGTTTHAKLFLQASVSSAFTLYLDNFSLKEVGIATGWTEADQQLDIPQTALMGGSRKMLFDGIDDYVRISSEVTFSAAFTFSMWVKGDFSSTPIQYAEVVGSSVSNTNIRITDSAGVIQLRVVNTVGAQITGIADNVWTHLVWVRNASNVFTAYKDGASISGNTVSGDFKFRDFGADGGIDYWIGIIDDISAFSAELSLAQVQELYNNGVPFDLVNNTITGSPTLTGYWRNNNLTTAGTWEDLSANTSHGTVNGSPVDVFFQSGLQSGRDSQGMFETHPQVGGGVLTFDGVGDLVAGIGMGDVFGEESLTVSCWFKADDVSGATIQFIWGEGHYSLPNKFGFGLGIVSSNLRGAGGNNDTTVWDNLAYSISSKTWYHATLVYDKTGGTTNDNFYYLYVDGELRDSFDTDLKPRFSGDYESYIIGCAGDHDASSNYDSFFKGQVDDVMLYNRALGVEEVLKNYNGSKGKHKN